MARKYLNLYTSINQTFAVKKLLLAPFLLASLFSFSGELKANPVDLTSKRTPTAAVNRWYLLSYATREERNITMGLLSNPPLKHHHNSTLAIGTWGFGESVPVPPPSIAFRTKAACDVEALKIKSFYSARLPKDFSHEHYITDKGDRNWISHTHRVPNAVRFKFKHVCIKGTVDY